ncbi:MAG: polymerase subunit beta [Bacteroidota bacterium]|nr:polymerase subunit beta [Bacteroidota bacterium]
MEQGFEIINEFKQAIKEIYGGRLEKIVLYGSYARGDFHKDSDIDILVVLKDDEVSFSEELKRVSDITWNIWERTFRNVHFLPMASNKFHTAKTPLLYWVRKEGKEI